MGGGGRELLKSSDGRFGGLLVKVVSQNVSVQVIYMKLATHYTWEE